ncbi:MULTISPECIES: iron chaperone [unclassified Paenibacillus]|uniref:iron chaperone n=1 Tax=unclassified Paenibacillus TaxID=185978 RepID=UPI000CFD3FD4|nr:MULTISPECIES: iron chaperone [unclassified Paenibacillus]MBD8837368.1 iron chaperone [Paenibacillus sp. CFBP 13594]PRA07396.1 iron chaperone [Paenibacillus sp. MYb63]PRA51041.1 iron chaperone [Paenibacillus sp. MYb67]QZN74170.1 iron chaperone [Paenibacillus sp. DR312]
METFAEFIARIDNPEHQARTEEVLNWITEKFPNLKQKIAWNQPMFTDHDTFIIGFSVSKQHLAVAPEKAGINRFSEEITQAGYDHTKELVRMKWKQEIDFSLLERMIEFNIKDKAECSTFWRK